MLCGTHGPASAHLRSLMPIRAYSSPGSSSSLRSKPTKSASAWIVAVGGGTRSLSNGCGGPLNTKTYTFVPITLSARRAAASLAASTSSIADACIPLLTDACPIPSTSMPCHSWSLRKPLIPTYLAATYRPILRVGLLLRGRAGCECQCNSQGPLVISKRCPDPERRS